MAYLIAGPLVALIGIVAVFFVLRRKSVEKRSMYSARRTQIEHKVRAARQRTLAGRGRPQHPAQAPSGAPSPFAQTEVQPTISYETPAYQPPPMAPPPPSAPVANPWDQTSAPSAPAPNPWEQTGAPSTASPWETPGTPGAAEPAYAPPSPEPFAPAPEPTPMAPSEPAWTPAPAPASEPVAPLEPAASVASPTSAGSWSIVSPANEPEAAHEPDRKKKKKDKEAGAANAWELASGVAPGMDEEEPVLKRSPGNLMAVAQYAVLVVGLVMVLIGVLVMVANSKVT